MKLNEVTESNLNEDKEVLLEFLPLIPLAIWAGGAAWTAYDAYQTAKQYQAGEIDGTEVATRLGTDVALSLAGGAIAKAMAKGAKAGLGIFRKIIKTSKAAPEVQDVLKAAPKGATVARGSTGRFEKLPPAPAPVKSVAQTAVDAGKAAIAAPGKAIAATKNAAAKLVDPLLRKQNIPTVGIDPLTKDFTKLTKPIDDRTLLKKAIDAPSAAINAIKKADDFVGDLPGRAVRGAKGAIARATGLDDPIATAARARALAQKELTAAEKAAAKAGKQIDKDKAAGVDTAAAKATAIANRKAAQDAAQQRIKSADELAARRTGQTADDIAKQASKKADDLAVAKTTGRAAGRTGRAVGRIAGAAAGAAAGLAAGNAGAGSLFTPKLVKLNDPLSLNRNA
jgi:hypothetical protein